MATPSPANEVILNHALLTCSGIFHLASEASVTPGKSVTVMAAMNNILDHILVQKHKEIEEHRTCITEQELERRCLQAPPIRDFYAALDQPGRMAFIAEVKKASPSAGILRQDFDPVKIGRTYLDHGAAAASVLTDGPFFQGKLADLSAIRAAVPLPLLRKDFILDRYQLLEARAAGADAVLLIAEILQEGQLAKLLRDCRELELQALVEIYEAESLQRVLDSGAILIGVNNRDLRTFTTRLEHTLELAAHVPADRLLVSESGIKTHQDVLRLQAGGVRAVLVGETLMRARDIGAKLDELRGVGRLADF
jgi:indole-3-glycerol phosphate synthase